jgi:hypothetical protein
VKIDEEAMNRVKSDTEHACGSVPLVGYWVEKSKQIRLKPHTQDMLEKRTAPGGRQPARKVNTVTYQKESLWALSSNKTEY